VLAMDEGDSPPLSASHTLCPYEMTPGMPSWAGMPAADSMARKLPSEPSAWVVGANAMAAAVAQAVVTPNSSRDVCFVLTIRSCYVFLASRIGPMDRSPAGDSLLVFVQPPVGPNAAPRGVDKETRRSSNEGEAQTIPGTPPAGIASYEGADVVTASEARKVARRLMCAANEIDHLSEQDWTAARRADA
jgi:hypothetical protein